MFAVGRNPVTKLAVVALCVAALPPVTVLLRAAEPSPDPLIEAARKAAAVYAQSLPDYIVKRTTSRYRGARASLSDPPESVTVWKQVDTVTADITAERSHEMYSNITVNGMPAIELPHGGAWSTGEFTMELQVILPLARNARFTHKHAETINGRAAFRYDFEVDAKHSGWHLASAQVPGQPAPQTLSPAYGGAITIDAETRQVLRVDMSARDMPNWFGLGAVHSITDYNLEKIGDGEYMLPVHSVSLTCERNGLFCLKNETVFRDYNKFSANSQITFESPSK
jgi:hypothetical protein